MRMRTACLLGLLLTRLLPAGAVPRGPDKLGAAIEELRGKIRGSTDSVTTALRQYSRLEAAEESMMRLASKNWGWYRRLNR